MKFDNWLNKVLSNREQRVKKQWELIDKYNSPLLSLTINIPGSIKQSDDARYIFDAALAQIESLHLPILEKVLTCKETGYEALMAFQGNAEEFKILTCSIEERHPLGRFMDIDIIDENKKILSRTSSRPCYLCSCAAKECARSQKHALDELLAYISQSVHDYKFSL